MNDRHANHKKKVLVSRREFLKGGALATAALSSGVLAVEPAEAGRVLEDISLDPRRSIVQLQVNGVPYRVEVPNRTTLLRLLREELKLTGTKMGCDRAQCGACTVVLNGRSVYSCTTLALEASGGEVLTIEGLAKGDKLHPIQQAFVEHSGFQCGFCTPGQIMSATGLISEGHAHTPDEIRELMSGNICRCGAYPGIVAAIRQVMEGKANGTV